MFQTLHEISKNLVFVWKYVWKYVNINVKKKKKISAPATVNYYSPKRTLFGGLSTVRIGIVLVAKNTHFCFPKTSQWAGTMVDTIIHRIVLKIV